MDELKQLSINLILKASTSMKHQLKINLITFLLI